MCVSPLMLFPYRDETKPNGITYRMRPPNDLEACLFDYNSGELFAPFEVPCGHCPECIQAHKQEWSHRLIDEWSAYDESMFLTLTYNDDNVPEEGVIKRHYQLFLKRFRKHIQPRKIRYFCCGEYGSKGKRPHYHLIIFGYQFSDLKFYRRDKKGFPMYRSATLEKLWTYGFSTVITTADKVLEYATKDMQKLLPLNDDRNPPFTAMSLKPGIGLIGAHPDWSSGKVYHYGKYKSIPKYYLNKFAESCPDEVFEVKKNRVQTAIQHGESSDEELAAKKLKWQKWYERLTEKK